MEYYLKIYLEGLRTVMKNTSHDRSNGLDLNPGLLEYEAREVPIPPMHSLIISRQVCCGVEVTTTMLFSSTENTPKPFLKIIFLIISQHVKMFDPSNENFRSFNDHSWFCLISLLLPRMRTEFES
jgi:hypothetical protein